MLAALSGGLADAEARMRTVEDYERIRISHRDGMSVRAIARTNHHSRLKVREALAEPQPRPYTRIKDRPLPKLDFLQRAPAEFRATLLDGYGLRDRMLTRPEMFHSN